MLIVSGTLESITLITSAVGDIRVSRSAADASSTPALLAFPDLGPVAAITTATTTTIVANPGAGNSRNVLNITIYNASASVSNNVTVNHTDGTNTTLLWFGTLAPSESVILDENGAWTDYSALGIPKTVGLPVTTKGDLVGFDTAPNRVAVGSDGTFLVAAASATAGVKWAKPVLTTVSTTTVSAGYATDTYLAGSAISMPAGGPVASTVYHCVFDMVKTAAGTATAIVNVRFGTAGTTADTAILTFTFAAGTAVADTGKFELWAVFRTVGSGTSAVVTGTIGCSHALAATGLISTGASGYGQFTTVSSGFNSTVAGSIIGVSFNGGTSFSGTNTIVEAHTYNLAV